MSAELFQEAVNSLGGRLDQTVQPPTTRSCLEWMAKHAGDYIHSVRSVHPKVPAIHFDFIDTMDINAYAFKHKNAYFIGLTLGMIGGIVTLFERILSDRRALPHLGDPSSDSIAPPLPEPLLPAIRNEIAALGPRLSRDPVRQAHTRYLATMAFNFVLWHELRHIINGHIDYREAKYGAPLLAEFGWRPTSANECLEMQALEIDADASAVAFHGMDMVQTQIEDPDVAPRDAAPYYRDFESIMFGWLFGVFSLFRTFGDAPLDGSDLSASTHPPFRFRVASVWELSGTTSIDFLNVPAERFGTVWREACYRTEESYHFMTGQPPLPRDRYLEGVAPVGRRYLDQLASLWHGGLMREVEKLAYVTRLLPWFDPSST